MAQAKKRPNKAAKAAQKVLEDSKFDKNSKQQKTSTCLGVYRRYLDIDKKKRLRY